MLYPAVVMERDGVLVVGHPQRDENGAISKESVRPYQFGIPNWLPEALGYIHAAPSLEIAKAKGKRFRASFPQLRRTISALRKGPIRESKFKYWADQSEYRKFHATVHRLLMSDIAFIPRSLEALGRLAKSQFKVLLASDQQPARRQGMSPQHIHYLNRYVRSWIHAVGGRIDGGRACMCDEKSPCRCLKPPEPAMLADLVRSYGVDPKQSWFIADTPRLLVSAEAMEFRTILVCTGRSQKRTPREERSESWEIVQNLYAAVDVIASNGTKR